MTASHIGNNASAQDYFRFADNPSESQSNHSQNAISDQISGRKAI